MAKVRIELNAQGIRDLLRSNDVISMMESRAAKVAPMSSRPDSIDAFRGRNRANVSIAADSEGELRGIMAALKGGG